MIKLLERVIEEKSREMVQAKKFPNQKLCENFLAYVISRLDIDTAPTIGAWLDDDDYWNSLEVNND